MLNEVLRLTQGDLTNVIKDDKEKDETKAHAEELYNASEICKEWSENARVKR